mgnify:CR=1 FL=1
MYKIHLYLFNLLFSHLFSKIDLSNFVELEGSPNYSSILFGLSSCFITI